MTPFEDLLFGHTTRTDRRRKIPEAPWVAEAERIIEKLLRPGKSSTLGRLDDLMRSMQRDPSPPPPPQSLQALLEKPPSIAVRWLVDGYKAWESKVARASVEGVKRAATLRSFKMLESAPALRVTPPNVVARSTYFETLPSQTSGVREQPMPTSDGVPGMELWLIQDPDELPHGLSADLWVGSEHEDIRLELSLL